MIHAVDIATNLDHAAYIEHGATNLDHAAYIEHGATNLDHAAYHFYIFKTVLKLMSALCRTLMTQGTRRMTAGHIS